MLSLAIVGVCVVVLIIRLLQLRKNPQPIEGVDYFPADAGKLIGEIKAEKAETAKKAQAAKKVKIPKTTEKEDDKNG